MKLSDRISFGVAILTFGVCGFLLGKAAYQPKEQPKSSCNISSIQELNECYDLVDELKRCCHEGREP